MGLFFCVEKTCTLWLGDSRDDPNVVLLLFFFCKQRGNLYYIKSAVATRVARLYKIALASLDKTSIIPKGGVI